MVSLSLREAGANTGWKVQGFYRGNTLRMERTRWGWEHCQAVKQGWPLGKMAQRWVAVSWTTLQWRDVSERPLESPPVNIAYQRGLRSPGNQAVSVSLLLSHWLKVVCGSVGSEERSIPLVDLMQWLSWSKSSPAQEGRNVWPSREGSHLEGVKRSRRWRKNQESSECG